jgi:hypothetical protein
MHEETSFWVASGTNAFPVRQEPHDIPMTAERVATTCWHASLGVSGGHHRGVEPLEGPFEDPLVDCNLHLAVENVRRLERVALDEGEVQEERQTFERDDPAECRFTRARMSPMRSSGGPPHGGARPTLRVLGTLHRLASGSISGRMAQ